MTPYQYEGGRDSCIGCADIIHTGDTVVPVSEDRHDRLFCVACWWLRECDLALPRWARGASNRVNLAGVFRAAAGRRAA